MARIYISEEQAQTLLAARQKSNRREIRRKVFADVRRQYNIPQNVKLKVAVETPDNPLYRVLRNKHTLVPLDNGIPEVEVSPAVSPAVSQAPAKKVAVKAPAKKVAVKAPAKKAAVKAAVKAPAKKVAVAAPKVTLAKVAVKRTKKGAFSPVRTPECNIEIRATIDGQRKRLGWASTEEMKQQVIANAKKA